MLVQKHANVTDEYFHKYWAKCSAPLAMDCGAFRENVVKYVSVSFPSFRFDLIFVERISRVVSNERKKVY